MPWPDFRTRFNNRPGRGGRAAPARRPTSTGSTVASSSENTSTPIGGRRSDLAASVRDEADRGRARRRPGSSRSCSAAGRKVVLGRGRTVARAAPRARDRRAPSRAPRRRRRSGSSARRPRALPRSAGRRARTISSAVAHVGDARPREKLDVHEQAVLGRAIAEPGERGGRVIDRPTAAEHVDRVERTGADRLGDARTRRLRRNAKSSSVSSAAGMCTSAAPGSHDHARSTSATTRPWSASIVADVGVRQALAARARVVARPQRDAREPAGRSRRRSARRNDACRVRAFPSTARDRRHRASWHPFRCTPSTRCGRRSGDLTVRPMDTVRIGILGAARIAPSAVIKPARNVGEAVIGAVAARDRSRADAFAVEARHPEGARLVRRRSSPTPTSTRSTTRSPTGCTRSGRSPRSRPASTCCARSRSPRTRRRPKTSPRSRTRTGLVVMEAFHYRYHPLAHRMREIVDSGELGTTRRVETALCFPLPEVLRHPLPVRPRGRRHDGRRHLHRAHGAPARPRGARGRVGRRRSCAPPTSTARCAPSSKFPSGHTGRITCSMWSKWVIQTYARVIGERGELHVINPTSPQMWHRMRVKVGRHTAHREVPAQAHLRVPTRGVLRGGAARRADAHAARPTRSPTCACSTRSTSPPE